MIFSENLKLFLENNKNKKIVFTNGCFDILHRGHVTYLNLARSHGDLLVIGLNSDESVKRLGKGDDRPINKEQDRKFILENLRCVDFVEIFNQDTPLELIRVIKPKVLVKGGDWAPEKIVGSQDVISWGGQVYSLSFVNGYSTTETISKIRAN